jgi:purine-binding chemotaxis protein CheW
MLLKVLSFRLEDKLFGIETKYVKEINRNIEYTKIPKAPKRVAGLFNMRGQIVTLFDLSNIFAYETGNNSEKKMCITLKSTPNNPNQAGFLIDRTEDVFDMEEENCEVLPANAVSEEQKYVKKVAKLNKELLILIDPELIIKE